MDPLTYMFVRSLQHDGPPAPPRRSRRLYGRRWTIRRPYVPARRSATSAR
jgi:hypothetical protein